MSHPHHGKAGKAQRTSSKSGNRISNRLVALSSAAVLSVYTAGYLRTSAAADRLETSSLQRRPVAPVQVEALLHPGQSETPSPPDRTVEQAERGAALAPAGVPAAAPGSPAAAQTADGNRQASARDVTEKPASNRDAAVVSTVAATTAIASTASAVLAAAEPVAPAAPVVAASEPIATSAPAAALAAPAVPKYKDGTYTGWGTSRHGDIEAQVVIQGGRIMSATISQCWTRYPCSYIAPLPPQVAQRQSPEIDFVSRATDSTNAFYYGLVQALAKAKNTDKD